MPFYFRKVNSINKILLTNQAGSYSFLKDDKELNSLISGDINHLKHEKIEELYAKNFISEEIEFDTRLSLIASKYATQISTAIRKPSLFIIVPTLRCDHSCSYCQVSRVDKNKSGYDLDKKYVNNVITFIDKLGDDSIKIEFQGGEPLLSFNFIKQIVYEAERRLQNKDVSFVICSALGPLSDEILDWCKDHKVVFSISLDGPEIIHNFNRPSRYFSPYTNVIRNLRRIQNYLGEERISCLATISKESLSHGKEIVDTYFELGLKSIFLRPLSPFGFASLRMSKIGYTENEYFQFYKDAIERVIELNQKRVFIEETAHIHLSKIFRFGAGNYVDLQSPAGYVLGALVINYDGKVFGSDEARMLWETTRAPELILGDLTNDSIGTLHKSNAASLLADTFLSCLPGCDECAYQPYCGADPLHHLSSQGDHIGDKSISFFCKLERDLFDFILSRYHTDSSTRMVFDLWLNQ